jgi:hypothetical protein
MVPQWGPYGERCSVSRANGSFIHVSQSPQLRSCPTKRENIWSPSMETTWTEGIHTMGWGLVPQGARLRHFCYYPSVMQLSARYQPPWLQWTRALLAGMCHSNPLQGNLSTPVTASNDPGYSSPHNPEVRTRDRIYRRLLHSILFFFWLILLLTSTTRLLLCVGNVSKLDHHIHFIYSSENNNDCSNIISKVRSAAHQLHVHSIYLTSIIWT